MVAQQIKRDRVQPGFLAPTPGIEATRCPQSALKRVCEKILGEGAVASAVVQECEQRRSVLGVESLKLLLPHGVAWLTCK